MDDYIQTLVEEAGRIATQCAMEGVPCRTLWIPPGNTDPPFGHIITIAYEKQLSASLPQPWENR